MYKNVFLDNFDGWAGRGYGVLVWECKGIHETCYSDQIGRVDVFY